MPQAIDLSGQRYGRYLVIKRKDSENHRLSEYWECICDCGNRRDVFGGNLRSGNSRSCGCENRENIKRIATVHGMRHTDEYRIWLGMKNRCLNSNDQNYHHYGGRGITICEEWKNDFMAFYNDMGPRPSKQHSVEREKNHLGYCKDNCKWATAEEQGNNRRNNIFFTYQGVSRTLANWCRVLKLPYKRIYYRIHRDKWSFEKAVTTPIN